MKTIYSALTCFLSQRKIGATGHLRRVNVLLFIVVLTLQLPFTCWSNHCLAAPLLLQIKDTNSGAGYSLPIYQIKDSFFVPLDELSDALQIHMEISPLSELITLEKDARVMNLRVNDSRGLTNDEIFLLPKPLAIFNAQPVIEISGLAPVVSRLFLRKSDFFPQEKLLVITSHSITRQTHKKESPLHQKEASEKKRSAGELKIITIDPGHGGSDSGAVGPSGVKEKDIVMAIAREFERILRTELGLTVFLTRNDDSFLTLKERVAIANHNHSDVFISIHTNSGSESEYKGFEVYYLNRVPSNATARESVLRENMGTIPGNGSEPDFQVGNILWDLAQSHYLQQSNALANSMLDVYARETKTEPRGVKQAPFMVLLGATMPAILVEVDFISNPAREALLQDNDYLKRIAGILAKGIIDYKEKLSLSMQPEP